MAGLIPIERPYTPIDTSPPSETLRREEDERVDRSRLIRERKIVEERGERLKPQRVRQLRARQRRAELIRERIPREEGIATAPDPWRGIEPLKPTDPEEFDYIKVPGRHWVSGSDVVNFLFGGEMAVIGMKLDNQGFR